MRLKLTLHLKDGRVLSGTYPYLAALARLEQAQQFPLYQDVHVEVVR